MADSSQSEAMVVQTNPAQSAETILKDLLKEAGSVSVRKLNSKLLEANIPDFSSEIERFKELDSEWKYHGRSFFTPARFEELRARAELVQEEEHSPNADGGEGLELEDRTTRSEEERRLCENYILPFLRSIYHNAHVPEDCEAAFCVQGERPSTQFRNVDLIAVNWRDDETAELVTVEAKLRFNAQCVQQASSYSRFSHRVWVAVVVESGIEVEEMAASLKEENPLLFEQVLHLGLGIIACQPGRGKSYACYPVQWPRKHEPDTYEKRRFLADYRDTFENAGLVAKVRRIGAVA